ncbi:MAG: alpha/beta fold hydrolase [Proteobacteria bacterium]|nr:alpha/beta fold hydrolase [Pseudomonadota bacterium]
MNKVGYVVGGVFSILVLGLFGAAWYFSSVLLYPGEHVCSEEHYVYCSDPSELSLAFEEVRLKTVDGLGLGGWYIPGRPGGPGILMVHGRGATRREALRYVPSLHAGGFNLLLIDLRHCGTSDKAFNSMGYHERKDVHAGIEYLLEEKKLPSAGVFGYSMGASTSIMAMAENERIGAGVFESGFSDFYVVTRQVAERDYGLPEYPLLPLVRTLCELRGDMSTTHPTPVTTIAAISPRPVFIIHGTGDQAVFHSHGQALFEAARHPKQFWSIPGGKHTQAWQADRQKAETSIPEFFNTYLKRPASN